MTTVVKSKTDGDSMIINKESTSTSLEYLKDIVAQDQKAVSDTPRIICNELLVKPQLLSSADNMDELSSLEREIAKMHHVEDSLEHLETALNVEAASTVYNINKRDFCNSDVYRTVNDELHGLESKADMRSESNINPIASGVTTLEHEDLIAVLKGLDDAHTNIKDSELLEGVTIEGEGEYQIMEVIDDDSSQFTDTFTSSAPIDTVNSSTKKFGTAVITTEEQRALALEQMECLKTKSRRRKQDIKPIKQTESAMDIVSALEAEWTDTDEDAKDLLGQRCNIGEIGQCIKSPLVTSVVVIPSDSNTLNSYEDANNTVSSTTTLNSETKEINKEKPTPVSGIIETKTEEESEFVATNTGFRRTRVIKRKIIWDPDAPETTLSYASLLTSKPKVKQDPVLIATSNSSKRITSVKSVKKETPNVPKKIQKVVTPKEKKIDTANSIVNKQTLIQKPTIHEMEDKSPVGSSDTSFSPVATISPTNKRRSQTPVPGFTKKRKITELAKLMSDEGAINMLNSLEKLESSYCENDSKPTRPMMRSRAATISEKIALQKDSSSECEQQLSNKGKRVVKPRASSNWDYVYKKTQQNFDDSMIIRRRSNSSYSSTTSVNRLSIDGPNNTSSKLNETTASSPSQASTKIAEDAATKNNRKSAGADSSSKNASSPISGEKLFEFAKPENKKTQKRTKSPAGTLTNDLKKPASSANKRGPRSTSTVVESKPDSGNTKLPVVPNSTIKEKSQPSDVVVKKSSKVTQIIFSTNKAKISYTFTTQMLTKLVDILEKLSSDPDTHVIVLTTNDVHFCQGVDLAELMASSSTEKRKIAVKNLLTALKKYLKTLASYPKPLIVGVNGNIMNLGVMQLALFDIVVAGDKCTYETPYVKLGQVPEGYSLWNVLHKIRGSFKTKLFWLSEKIQSTEAVLAGLVNKLTAANKVNEEAVLIAKKIAAMSPKVYRTMKSTTNQCYLNVIDASFEEEFDTIAEQWSSVEFIENAKKYIDQGHFVF